LPFTRGYISLADFRLAIGNQSHTFAWDNVAFDGPKPYRDLTFDVPESKVPADGLHILHGGVHRRSKQECDA
jgi:hypothetical protein